MSARNGISHDEERGLYIVTLGGDEVGAFDTRGRALRALENGHGHTLGDAGLPAVGERSGTTEQEGPPDARSARTAQRLTSYQRTLAQLRAECAECADGSSRPDWVGHLSWHEWGHCPEGAPDDTPRCRCRTELKSTQSFWHCGGCHETFHGEDAFTRHRRGRGEARYCHEPRSAGRVRDWWTAKGVWHYGSRRDFLGATRVTPPGVHEEQGQQAA